jgi:hypothetical protein
LRDEIKKGRERAMRKNGLQRDEEMQRGRDWERE